MSYTVQDPCYTCCRSLDQPLFRSLLLSWDRPQGNELVLTQESIANMVGVRREDVTEAALKLRKIGLIHYLRGHLTVLDRDGLASRSGERHSVVEDEKKRGPRWCPVDSPPIASGPTAAAGIFTS